MRTNLLAHYSANNLLRKRQVVEKRHHHLVATPDKNLINFCSNDYLNLSTDVQVKQAFVEGVTLYGLGSGASPVVNGYSKAHQRLEEACADFLERDRALLFNSGYHANIGVLGALANRKSIIIADKYSHASLHEGAALTHATFRRYKHNDVMHAEDLLLHYANSSSPQLNATRLKSDGLFLISEGVFSIQGDIAPADKLAVLAKQYRATFILDDAHGIGILGNEGRGICEHTGLTQQDVPCLIVPFGKALGSMGAVVAGNQDLIETILQLARSYRYSTALPPAVCHATLTALHLLKTQHWRREKLQELICLFNLESKKRGLMLLSYDMTPIKSIIIGDNQQAVLLQEKLANDGLLIACIRPPTVPVNHACLRISLSCMHQPQQIISLLDKLAEYYALTPII